MAALSCDVAVVGAGAAGLMAAACASARGRRTVLLEKNERPGLKILISGGGRCNLTTTLAGRVLEEQYGAVRGRFLRHALRAFPPTALVDLVEGLGVRLHEEDLDKIFPVSRRARDVLDALLRHAADQGVDLRLGWPVRAVARVVPETAGATPGATPGAPARATGGSGRDGAEDGAAFALQTPHGEVRAQSLVLATGGLSYPKTGATGDGYGFCRVFGHTITRTMPALAPLDVPAPWVRALQGIVVDGVDLSVLDREGRVVRTRRRPILFTHQGLSGPAPMDLSGDVEELGGAELRFAFAPAAQRAQREAEWLAAARDHGRRGVDAVLPRELPERLRAALCAEAGVAGATLASWTRDGRRALHEALENLRVFAPRSLGFDKAEVTRGGVALDEVDPRTMQSRFVPGLFVCGELLDVDGPIGGFNFQAAFATGRLAGLAA